MSGWKYKKAVLAGFGTGLCLMSLIAALQDNRWPWYKHLLIVGGFGIGCGLGISCLVYERDERRRYQRLYESDNKRMKMLCGGEKIDPKVKSDIEEKLEKNLEHNLDEESALLNGGSMIGKKPMDAKLQSMNDKLEEIIGLLKHSSNSASGHNRNPSSPTPSTSTSNGQS